MAYQYDVFISYKANEHTNPWVKGFKDKFEFWLMQALGGYKPNIFYSPEKIDNGMLWEPVLTESLKKSKCILCLWTPEYFKSEWCVYEWRTFESRWLQLNNDAIIRAIKLIDEESYHADARARQSADFREFIPTVMIENSLNSLQFNNAIMQLAEDVSASVCEAPDYIDFVVIDFNQTKNMYVQPNIPRRTRITL